MEVMRMALERERLINEILAVQREWGGGVGVYGAGVCALCGQIDTFRGWVMAAYGCHFGPHGEFVVPTMQKPVDPEGGDRDQRTQPLGQGRPERVEGSVLPGLRAPD